jgi:hypothetical protein
MYIGPKNCDVKLQEALSTSLKKSAIRVPRLVVRCPKVDRELASPALCDLRPHVPATGAGDAGLMGPGPKEIEAEFWG